MVTSGKPEMRMGPKAWVSELEGGPGAMKIERWLTARHINGMTSSWHLRCLLLCPRPRETCVTTLCLGVSFCKAGTIKAPE